jgi:hypothetical protein
MLSSAAFAASSAAFAAPTTVGASLNRWLAETHLCRRDRSNNFAARRTGSSMSATTSNDLLIVGPGVLGQRVAAQWLGKYPGASVIGETRSTTSHAALAVEGITPTVYSPDAELTQYNRVVFCAPPRGNADYPGSVRAAAARTAPGGVFVFTSSGGAYADTGGVLVESSQSAEGPRAAGLLAAEDAALGIPEGRIVRMAGLYTLKRGAHNYWLNAGTVAGSRGGLVNLLHYDDAAGIVVAILEACGRDDGMRLFLGADGSPVTREEICAAARSHPMFERLSMPTFDEAGGGSTKTYDNSASRKALGWEPVWSSFSAFMRAETDVARGVKFV